MKSTPSPLATPEAWNLVSRGYAEESFDHFAVYARDALELAGVRASDQLLDVAAGPGSLAVQAAPRVAAVQAVDFSSEMLAELAARVAKHGLLNVTAQRADGQALPFADARFDVAFSMFGLIFFPDRAQGFRELYRVLVPGGRAVVSSWHPMTQVPVLASTFAALADALPNLPFGDGKGPLTDPDDFRRELSAAGFRDVEIVIRTHAVEAPSIDDFWRSMRRSLAQLVLLEQRMGAAAFAPVADAIEARLRAEHAGAVRVEMPAWLGIARK